MHHLKCQFLHLNVSLSLCTLKSHCDNYAGTIHYIGQAEFLPIHKKELNTPKVCFDKC